MLQKLMGAAALVLALAAPAMAGPADDPANWRKIDPENLLVFTIKGQEVLIELRPDFAPKHVERVKKIVRDENWNALPFHRVIDDFMAQGGETYAKYQIYPRYGELKAEFTFKRDPKKQPVKWFAKDGEGKGIGYLDGFIVQGQPDSVAMISDPPVAKTWGAHCPGIASMARTPDPDSAETQFFLMRQERTSVLDQEYTIWGRALTGLDVIRAIKHGDEEKNGVLTFAEADKLTKAVIAKDMKSHLQPTVYVRRTDGPEFASRLASYAIDNIVSACALPQIDVVVERPNQ
jgi:peptidylprolyl isomerase